MLFIFFQSVVLISKLPFIQLFNYVADNIAPEYFDSGEPALEAGNEVYYVLIMPLLSVLGAIM